jgi:hypothetical protein
VTAKYANHAKKEADWGFPSRIWRISRLNLFASCRRPIGPGLDRAKSPVGERCETNPIPGCAGWDEGQICETKPISAGENIPPFQSDADRATSPRCPASGNKANFRQPGRRGPVRCAKQTQFSQGHEKRQMLSTKGFMDNRTCERPRQNKANSCTDEATAGGRGDYAKQSRFGPRGRQRRRSNPILRNKANWPERIVQNEPNSARAMRSGKYLLEKELW